MTDSESPVPQNSFEFTGDAAAFWSAFAKAQGAFQPILKTKTVTVYPKQRSDGSRPQPYTFYYAPLDEVLAKTIPALNANGFSLIQPMAGNPKELKTMLMHGSGGLVLTLNLPPAQDIQALGSSITYLRRYSVSCLLGIASEEDDDGNAADGNTVDQKQDRTRPPPVKPTPKPAAHPDQNVPQTSHVLEHRPPPPDAPHDRENQHKPAPEPQPSAATDEKRDTAPAPAPNSDPMTQTTEMAVTKLAMEFKFNKPQMAQFCIKTIGRSISKADGTATEEEGQKLLKALEELKASAEA